MEIVMIVLSSLLTNNIVLTQSYGLCPYVGMSKRVDTSFKLSLAVLFVLTFSTIINYIIFNFVLVPLNLTYLNTIAFIIIIACLVQCLDMFIKRFATKLHQVLGIYLPLITTNCVILGVVELVVMEANFGFALLKSVSLGLGFMLAICLLASIRENINNKETPKIANGLPIVLVLAGFIALAFETFSGMVKAPSTNKNVVLSLEASPLTILYAVLILLAIMIFACVIIYLTNKLTNKKSNPLDSEAQELLKYLPGANCGACGNPSCIEFAKNLLQGKIRYTDCKVLKNDAQLALKKYMEDKQKSESRD